MADMEYMEEELDLVTLTDEEGNAVDFEFLATYECQGKEYAVLLPLDESDNELVILEVVESEDDEEELLYNNVEDENVLRIVFEMFKEEFKDEFNFAD